MRNALPCRVAVKRVENNDRHSQCAPSRCRQCRLPRNPGANFLLDQLGDDTRLIDVGKAFVAAIVVERQALMVEPQEVQNGGMQIGRLRAPLDGPITEIVGRAVRLTAADSAASQPDAESVWVMVAP